MLFILLTLGCISLIAKLDKKHQEALLSDTTNPFPQDWFGASMSATAAPAQSTSNPKQSMRDTIAQQRLQNQATLSRSGSAAEMATPARDISARMPARYVDIISLRRLSTCL